MLIELTLGVDDVNIFDWDTKQRRRGTLEDTEKAVLFVNDLDLVNTLYVAVLPSEIHPELVAGMFTVLEHTLE